MDLETWFDHHLIVYHNNIFINHFTCKQQRATMPKKESLSGLCDEAVSRLVAKGINFLALDFDQTIISIHTGGRFKGSIAELSSYVRPLFIDLIRLAYANGIKIAVVTFSPQVDHIARVLENLFPEFAHEIVIRGRNGSFHYEGNGMKQGKQPFMASACEELLTKNREMNISKNTTLLVDDDSNNIRLALSDGVRAILFLPDQSHKLIQDIFSMP